MKKTLGNSAIELKWRLVGLLAKLLMQGLCFGTRIETVGLGKVHDVLESRKYILACWHSRMFLIMHRFRKIRAVALASKSKDGEIVARMLQAQGHVLVRGSTGKGGLRALSQQIALMKATGSPGAVTPDGPRGPRFKVQPGVIILAQKTGFPILPITYSVSRAKVFNSWDRFMLPLPFSRGCVICAEPIYVQPDADKTRIEDYQQLLEAELCRITVKADGFFGRHVN